jgi:hypothetical protein
MIINDTFMWLYAAYKFGTFCIAPFILCVLLSIFAIAMFCEPIGDSRRYACIIWKISAFVVPISLFFIVITPSAFELKAYAAYAISKDIVNSDESKELLDAVTKFLEGETKNKD